ncbi:MAG: thioredoxin fold domain-containing protein [Gammaproteobacteria bacterium]|nr:thioredoxin fold domain-containing protein [Gammaproteobacteria bacterium]
MDILKVWPTGWIEGFIVYTRFVIGLLLVFLLQPLAAEEKQHGKMLGAKTSETPHWFKESFLEFEEDVAEAAEQGKRVMLYFHQEGCPYCARLVEENFANPETESFVRENFDGITINMWGDREVVNVSGQSFTEKSFAAALRVQYTPTLVFLDERGKVVLRLNGYYPPDQFQHALHYVAGKGEQQGSFSDYVMALQKQPGGSLIAEDFFQDTTDLQQLIGRQGRPLAVFFEAGNCKTCQIMHERILVDEPTRKLARRMNNVQFDIHSKQSITTPDGKATNLSEWTRKLGINYTPSIVFFDENGKEVMRISAFVKTFHFQSVFAYVLEKAYLTQPSFQRYISARGDAIREAGYNTDIWGYQSSHQ